MNISDTIVALSKVESVVQEHLQARCLESITLASNEVEARDALLLVSQCLRDQKVAASKFLSLCHLIEQAD